MDQELKKLLQQNADLNQQILETVKYIKRYVIFQKVWGVIKILIVVIPIILGIIYLPPLLKNTFEPFRELFSIVDNVNGIEDVFNGGRANLLK